MQEPARGPKDCLFLDLLDNAKTVIGVNDLVAYQK
jgi:hypothetical protein